MAGRNVIFEYEIGEIVLCFEPDTTKARVLYEAKVVEQRTIKEVGEKKKPAYIVHFQGWNSSWDRQVGDNYLLRDTVENRQLMRKLAETAKKFCRKNSQSRHRINAILHHAFGGAPPEFAAVSESDSSEEESDTGKRPGKGKTAPDKKRQKTSLIDYEIPESLRVQLEDDYISINKRNKLTCIPSKPCVLDILESFMKTFCVNYLCEPRGGREKTRNSSSKHTLKCPPDKCVSLCKEFVDSLRVIFDHTLPVVLLYAAEQQQYEHAMENIKSVDLIMKDRSYAESNSKGGKHEATSHTRNKGEKTSKILHQQRLDSPAPLSNSSSSSPRAPSPPRRLTRQTLQDLPQQQDQDHTLSSHNHHPHHQVSTKSKSSTGQKSPKHQSHHSPISPKSPRKTDKEFETSQEPVIPIASRTRRRSQFETAEVSYEVLVKQELNSDVNYDHHFIVLPGTSYESSEVSTNGQQQQEVSGSAAGTESPTMGSSRGREDAMDHILGWQLLPMDVRLRSPITPSQVYGTVHLLRMFVKLPELLRKMNMKDVLMQIIVKFIHHCLQYLVDHQGELFHDHIYVNA